MSGLASRRRVWVLVAVAVVTAVVLWHAGSPRHAVPAARGLFRQRGSDAHSAYAAHLAHPSEADALPLVAAVASFSLVASPGERAHVAVCAVPTHEEQYLPEWLTWHRLVGVERFYLFDNQPSTRMRRLLRPWIDEGTVVLYELEYEDGVDIGAVYQNHVLRLCERDVLPVTSWVSHHDVDEFLMVDAPGWSPTLPSLVNSSRSAADPSSPLFHDGAPDADDKEAGDASAPSQRWTYPLHARFDSLLSEATCVPMLRLPFQNYGVRILEPTDFVTERQTVKDRVPPNFHTYGKMFIHPKEGSLNAGWLGPHSCRATTGGAVMDAQGMELLFESTTYPYAGAPLPQEGIMLYHYIQRSLADCRAKYHVLSSTPQDWRTRDGLAGCARNYVPLDAELATPAARAQLVADDPEHGDELAARPESWGVLFTRDTSARDSWQGRMTRAILAEWRARGGKEAREQGRWWWEMGDEASDERLEGMMSGIVSVESVGRGIPPKVRLEAVVPQ